MLVAVLTQSTEVTVGRLGLAAFPPGWYVYAGSAHGPGGIGARLARHLRPGHQKRAHWHIDYLLAHARVTEAWARPGWEPLECRWASALAEAEGALRMPPRFGASDCGCPGHLVCLPQRPSAHRLMEMGLHPVLARLPAP
ncbi:MAG: GIY-YIG nuclease family protein [Chloroflexi bacterium]|nr:GIY-YIG nuclease family protein [Chloroflexota bacterium]